jgi:Chitin binding Peritrophin-A domain
MFSQFMTCLAVCITIVSSAPKRVRSKRPTTKARNQIIVPPVSCVELYEATIDIGDEGPLIRKSQHNSDCKKYFECVTNHWIARDCPDGTTFNGDLKGCDSSKSCKPSNIKELYDDAVSELKGFLGIEDPDRPEI